MAEGAGNEERRLLRYSAVSCSLLFMAFTSSPSGAVTQFAHQTTPGGELSPQL